MDDTTQVDPEEIALADEMIARIRADERRFMETVQIGDIVYASEYEDKRFTFSDFKYCTAMKGYKVIGFSVHGSSVHCECDITGQTQYLTSHRIRRNGSVIFDSRTIIEWEYEGTVYFGYYVKSYDVDRNNNLEGDEKTERFTILVQLITPFKEGVKDDLICVDNDECFNIKFNGVLESKTQKP